MSYLTEHVTKTVVMSHAAHKRELYFRVQENMGNGFLCIRFLHRMYVNKKIIKLNSYPTCSTDLKIGWKFFLMKLVTLLESWVISQHSFLLLLMNYSQNRRQNTLYFLYDLNKFWTGIDNHTNLSLRKRWLF